MSIPTPPPRIAAIHDLSCMGRCALTVIMPTLSVMGFQVVPLPTALLSTHTGGFTDLHFHDLTPDMEKISDHFSSLGLSFRAIYTGFLGSFPQIESVSHFLDRFENVPDESGEMPVVLIDPVMGDDGELYSTYTEDLMRGMKRLARRAQILTPNLTEACFLTDTPYRDSREMTADEAQAFAEELLDRLSCVTAGMTVITGISQSDGTVANVGRTADGATFCVRRPHTTPSYPGTGDLFASVLLGEYLREKDFERAVSAAADFVGQVIVESANIPTPVRNGVALESHLWKLTEKRS
ncbi:MAG: pyridoxamine kinase [Ruminococcaceae bacterium]|nr:pyridoxamine kinase [Oscillospiraceae bacterium]